MKSKKKFVLAGLMLLATVLVLPLVGCDTGSGGGSVAQKPATNTPGGGTDGNGGNGGNGEEYTVSFNANGGKFADGKDTKTETVESGQTATRPEPDPTKAKWVFAGWYTLKDDGETLADTAYSFDTTVEGDIILYAAWNGWDSEGNIVLRNKVMSKTSEVQVLSEAVDLSSLYVVDSEGKSVSYIFEEKREGSIQPFVMGQYEVTQQLYSAVMGSNPSYFTSDVAAEETQELRPVEQVSWYDAVVFCNKLSQLMGLEPVYSKGGTTDTSGWGEVPTSSDEGWNAITCDFTKSGYRLPTSAEWELAARGGDPEEGAWKDSYAGSSTVDGVAWYYNNSDRKTHEVGRKKANGLKLHDMSGNVEEWCWDWRANITAGTQRVCRGGGWNVLGGSVKGIGSDIPSYRDYGNGFRLVRSAN